MKLRRTRLSMRSPLHTAHGLITDRDALLLGIEDGPHTGWGECAPLAGFGNPVDLDAIDLELRGLRPASPAAAALHDSAQADAQARRHGRPLSDELAGRTVNRRVAVNTTIGDAEPAEVGTRCTMFKSQGFTAVKLKVAVGSIDRDVERVAAARQALGPSIEIRLDANQGWTREHAAAAIRELRHLNIAFIEEPTPNPGDMQSLAKLEVALALDESLIAAVHAADLANSAASVLVLKPAILGGPRSTFDLATAAQQAGKRIIVTSFFDGPVGLATAIHVAAAVGDVGPHGLATAAHVNAPFPEWMYPVDGYITIPELPGLGVVP